MHNNILLFTRNDALAWAYWVSYGTWFLMENWIRFRDRREAKGIDADRGTMYAIMAAVPIAILGAFTAAFMLPRAQFANAGLPLLIAALVLIWGGMALRLWSVLTLGRFFRTVVRLHDDHELVTHGPYRLLRHPSYTGSLLSFLGLGLAIGNWMSVLIAVVPPLIAFIWRLQVEEAALAGRFGQLFEDQRRRSWRLIPFIW